ncbi:MAG: hypothetical protein ABR501_11585 [Pyrinomonadaceae bacterium]
MSEKVFRKLSRIQTRASELFRPLQLPGHALLCIYFAVFARQYLWWVTDNNFIAWSASAVVAVLVTWLYILSEERTAEEKVELPFWLVVVGPLALVYAMRVALPDISFDVLNYHLFHGERTLRGFLYLPGEFFPTPSPFSPAPDMVTGIFRKILGYRLGTFVNFLAVIWVARIADKLLRPFLPGPWLRATGILLAVLAEHVLGEINNYMPDLLAIPLLLEATNLVLRHYDYKNAYLNFVRIALLLGMSVAFKLTNAAFALPIVLLCAYRALAERRPDGTNQAKKNIDVRRLGFTTVLSAVAFFAPLLPFLLYLYRETGSPIFPVYNGIFKSVYWPPSNVWDPRWGPFGLWEKLLWPILISFNAKRISELPIYSGRISSGFVLALIALVFVRRNARIRDLCLVVVAASLFWSASTGYIRYALYLEVMAPIVLLALAATLLQMSNRSVRPVAVATGTLICVALIFHACVGLYYLSKWELSQRPTFFKQAGVHLDEASYFLRDYSLRNSLNPAHRASFERVQVWIISSIKTSGLAVLLKPDAPMIGVNNLEFFHNQESRERFNRALQSAAGKRMFSLALAGDLETAKANLRRSGFAVAEITPMQIPFYSAQGTIAVHLIEVTVGGRDLFGKAQDSARDKNVELAASAYRAKISAMQQPAVIKAGSKEALQVKVRNEGDYVWQARAPQGWKNIVTLGDRWLTADGSRVVNDMDARAVLPHNLKPREEAEITLTVTAPQKPGKYILELDMVHEGVTWFYEQGSVTLRWHVEVESN